MRQTYTVVFYDNRYPTLWQYGKKMKIKKELYHQLLDENFTEGEFDNQRYRIIDRLEFLDNSEFSSNLYVVIVGQIIIPGQK